MTPTSNTEMSTVIPILMPEAGNTMEEGTVLTWLVGEGDRVSVGDVLCEIETDKATMEYESPAAGRLVKVIAAEGDTVAVKQPIAYLAETNAELDVFLAAAVTDSSPGVSVPAANQRMAAFSEIHLRPPAETGLPYPASPAVRRLSRQLGIDLKLLGQGSGPGGRILTTDLQRWKTVSPGSAFASVSPATGESAGTMRRPISKMRRRIGERLVAAKQSIPHFYVRVTILADELYRVFREKKSAGCTLNDLVVLACGKVLPQFPAFRSRIEGEEMTEESGAHIGIAVGLEEGLVVPVIRNVQNLSLDELSRESKRIMDDARRGLVANIGSGVFTISNLGMFGVEEFSAIINPPESAILAVGALREQVIVENGAMRPGRVMTLTLAADHRLIDGVLAAKFLTELRRILENAGLLKD